MNKLELFLDSRVKSFQLYNKMEEVLKQYNDAHDREYEKLLMSPSVHINFVDKPMAKSVYYDFIDLARVLDEYEKWGRDEWSNFISMLSMAFDTKGRGLAIENAIAALGYHVNRMVFETIKDPPDFFKYDAAEEKYVLMFDETHTFDPEVLEKDYLKCFRKNDNEFYYDADFKFKVDPVDGFVYYDLLGSVNKDTRLLTEGEIRGYCRVQSASKSVPGEKPVGPQSTKEAGSIEEMTEDGYIYEMNGKYYAHCSGLGFKYPVEVTKDDGTKEIRYIGPELVDVSEDIENDLIESEVEYRIQKKICKEEGVWSDDGEAYIQRFPGENDPGASGTLPSDPKVGDTFEVRVASQDENWFHLYKYEGKSSYSAYSMQTYIKLFIEKITTPNLALFLSKLKNVIPKLVWLRGDGLRNLNIHVEIVEINIDIQETYEQNDYYRLMRYSEVKNENENVNLEVKNDTKVRRKLPNKRSKQNSL